MTKQEATIEAKKLIELEAKKLIELQGRIIGLSAINDALTTQLQEINSLVGSIVQRLHTAENDLDTTHG